MKSLAVLLATLLLTGCATAPVAPSVALPLAMNTETLGNSVNGRPILLHRFGNGPVGTLIISGVHGDETSAWALGERLVELLKQESVPGVTEAIAVIPHANPDGVAAMTRRNSRNVDINRNFPARNWGTSRKGVYYGGPAPASEPETVALRNAVLSLNPRRIISIHSIGGGRECNNYDGPGESLARRMAVHNGYPAPDTIGYPTPGSFGSWAGGDLQIPVITLELPKKLPAEKAWETNRQALLESLKAR